MISAPQNVPCPVCQQPLTLKLAQGRKPGKTEREYLLKGLIKCAHCGMSLWAQTLKSGSRMYREQARSRSHIECPGDSNTNSGYP